MKTTKLEKLHPCQDAIGWAKAQKSEQHAWETCERGDWMLWLLGKLAGKPESESRKRLVLTACQCARLSLRYISEDEKRPLRAIETAESWAHGGASLNEVGKAAVVAAYAAYDAAYDVAADAAAAYDAVDAAAYTAVCDAADVAAAAAADAADAAAYAAYDAAKRQEVLKECSDIVRDFYPNAPRII